MSDPQQPPQSFPPQSQPGTQPIPQPGQSAAGQGWPTQPPGPGQSMPGQSMQSGYGAPDVPTPAWAQPKPSRMPDHPVEYQHLVRGRTFRWWRPLLVFLLCFVFAFIAQIALAIVGIVIKMAMGGDPMDFVNNLALTGPMDALTFAYVGAGLAALIPSAMFASWIVNGVRPRFLSSVAGGLRWSWLARCLVITVPIFAAYLAINFAIGWDHGPKPPQWVALLILVVIAIPFQSAGEEYVFRGLILQNVGAWIRHPLAAFIVAGIPAVALFALAHGGFDPWVLADLSAFAIAACIVTWRTGGLEAAIALHATNNILLMICTILFGGWAGAFVSESTQGSPIAVLGTVLVLGASTALILWQAKRLGIQRTYQPEQAQSAAAVV